MNPTDGSDSTPSHPKVHQPGTWVVVFLLAAGCLAGLIAVSYWRSRVVATEANNVSTGDPVSSRWDPAQARQELEPLQQRFAGAVEARAKGLKPIIDALEEFLTRYPRYAPGHTLMGQVLLKNGQSGPAIEHLTLSLELDGQQPEVHILAGTVEYQNRRFDRAQHHYSMAVGLAPSQLRYRLHLAQAQIRLKQYDEARRGLLEALRIDSSSHEAYATLADLYATQNKLTLALSMIHKALENTPVAQRDRRVTYTLRQAQLLRRDNQPQEALLALQSLNAIEQDTEPVLENTALCWAMMDRPEEAAAVYERALASDPTAWRHAAAAARWRIQAGQKQAAHAHLETLRKINPRADQLEELKELLDR